MNSMKFKTGVASVLSLAGAAILLVAAGVAQSTPPPPPAPPHDAFFIGRPGLAGGMMGGELGEGKTVTGAPLSGIVTVTRDTALGDGNKIHNESQTKVYRDSQGRIRRELDVDLITPATGNVKRNVVIIVDPVAGQRYVLNPDNKTARAMPVHGRGHESREHAGPMKPLGGEGESGGVTKEDLGTKTVNGVQAEGVRVTRTIAAGAIGNDKPIHVVTERWYSPDLQIAVLTTHTDPMMGTVTTKLTNVTRGEPDASLFQVPPDYKVETGRPNEPMYLPMKP